MRFLLNAVICFITFCVKTCSLFVPSTVPLWKWMKIHCSICFCTENKHLCNVFHSNIGTFSPLKIPKYSATLPAPLVLFKPVTKCEKMWVSSFLNILSIFEHLYLNCTLHWVQQLQTWNSTIAPVTQIPPKPDHMGVERLYMKPS